MLWLCLIESMPNQKRNTSAEYTTRRLFTGLDCNKFYYIRFYNNSSTSPAISMDISVTILVDDSYN